MYVDVATNDDKLPLTCQFEIGPSGASPPPCGYSIHSRAAQYGGQHDRAPRVSRGRSANLRWDAERTEASCIHPWLGLKSEILPQTLK